MNLSAVEGDTDSLIIIFYFFFLVQVLCMSYLYCFLLNFAFLSTLIEVLAYHG